MAMIQCKECGKEISPEAKSCPNCGAPNQVASQAPSTSPVQKKLSTGQIIGGLAVAGAVFWFMNHKHDAAPVAPTSNTTASASASASAANATTTPLNDCQGDLVSNIDVHGVSHDDISQACTAIHTVTGQIPSTKLLSGMGDAIYAFHYVGLKSEPGELVYQLTAIAKARGFTEDAAILHSNDVVVKCYQAGNGQVTPRDIIKELIGAPELAKTMSDDGIYSMCAMIQQSKNNSGQ